MGWRSRQHLGCLEPGRYGRLGIRQRNAPPLVLLRYLGGLAIMRIDAPCMMTPCMRHERRVGAPRFLGPLCASNASRLEGEPAVVRSGRNRTVAERMPRCLSRPRTSHSRRDTLRLGAAAGLAAAAGATLASVTAAQTPEVEGGISWTKQTVSLAAVERMLAAAQAKATELEAPVAIAVVNEGGLLKAFHRMDGLVSAVRTILPRSRRTPRPRFAPRPICWPRPISTIRRGWHPSRMCLVSRCWLGATPLRRERSSSGASGSAAPVQKTTCSSPKPDSPRLRPN